MTPSYAFAATSAKFDVCNMNNSLKFNHSSWYLPLLFVQFDGNVIVHGAKHFVIWLYVRGGAILTQTITFLYSDKQANTFCCKSVRDIISLKHITELPLIYCVTIVMHEFQRIAQSSYGPFRWQSVYKDAPENGWQTFKWANSRIYTNVRINIGIVWKEIIREGQCATKRYLCVLRRYVDFN